MPKEKAIEYSRLQDNEAFRDAELWECSICGAAVSNQMTHTDNHLSFANLIEAYEARYEQFRGYTEATNRAILQLRDVIDIMLSTEPEKENK